MATASKRQMNQSSSLQLSGLARNECLGHCWNFPVPMEQPPTTSRNILAIDPLNDPVFHLYTKLFPWQIRLLKIFPGARAADLESTLVITDLVHSEGVLIHGTAHLIAFQALSYTWGSDAPTQQLKINGSSFAITKNLEDVLLQLRPTRGYTYLWVDAICINQEDLQERAQQVTMMLQIYQKAASVVVWLGAEQGDSATAFQSINNLGLLLPALENAKTLAHSTECMQQLCRKQKSLSNLIRRPWLRRTWVRQEAYAARNIIVRCGNAAADWESFLRVPELLSKIEGVLDHGLQQYDPHDRKDYLLMLDFAETLANHSRSSWKPPRDLLKVLISSRYFQVTDTKDTIYAILGMTGVPVRACRDILTSNGDNYITIDYSLALADINRDMTMYLLSNSQNDPKAGRLIFHCITHFRASSQGAPSWVMDWRETLCPENEVERLLEYPLKKGDRHYFPLSPFFACPRKTPETCSRKIQLWPSPCCKDILLLKSRIYGHIEELVDQSCDIDVFACMMSKKTRGFFLEGDSVVVLPFPGVQLFEKNKHTRRLALVCHTKQRTLALVPATAAPGDFLAAVSFELLPLVLRLQARSKDSNDPSVVVDKDSPQWMYGNSKRWTSYDKIGGQSEALFQLHGPAVLSHDLTQNFTQLGTNSYKGDLKDHTPTEILWGGLSNDIFALREHVLRII